MLNWMWHYSLQEESFWQILIILYFLHVFVFLYQNAIKAKHNYKGEIDRFDNKNILALLFANRLEDIVLKRYISIEHSFFFFFLTALHFSAHCPAIQAQGHYGKEKRQSESQPNIRKTVMPFQHGDEGRGWGEGGWEGWNLLDYLKVSLLFLIYCEHQHYLL